MVAEKPAKKAASKGEKDEVPELNIQKMDLVLVGNTPLIVHNWSKKAKEQILFKQQKKASKGKEIRDPEKDFRESLYVIEEGVYGFPVIAFKAAAVTACSQIGDMKKVFARQTFHVLGPDLIQLRGEVEPDAITTPTMREDMVRVGMGTADLRYRGEFKKWWVLLEIEYNASAISREQLINIFNTAGFGVGVGEWRPEKDGRNGRFHVAGPEEAEKYRASVGKAA